MNSAKWWKTWNRIETLNWIEKLVHNSWIYKHREIVSSSIKRTLNSKADLCMYKICSGFGFTYNVMNFYVECVQCTQQCNSNTQFIPFLPSSRWLLRSHVNEMQSPFIMLAYLLYQTLSWKLRNGFCLIKMIYDFPESLQPLKPTSMCWKLHAKEFT